MMRSRVPKVLVIDDGDRYVELLHALLRDYEYATRCELRGPCWECPAREGCQLTHARDWGEAQQALTRHPDLDVVLLDMYFDLPVSRLLQVPPTSASDTRAAPDAPGADEHETERRKSGQGLAILRALRQRRPALPVVLMTSTAHLRERALQVDADEYVTLAGTDAFDARAMGLLIERIVARGAARGASGGYVFGSSPAMLRLRRDAEVLSRTSLPVLIEGEAGTGKSALAKRVVHPATGRRGDFVSVDLSAVPRDLIASELFGSARGAFSGATDRGGCFEAADGGTLFLDEIGNLSPDAQRMLLLVLQERQVTRLGEQRPRQVDVKLIAATNADLAYEVRSGGFRADLYARLNPAARLRVPPLRERREDLPALMQAALRETFAQSADGALLADYAEQVGLGAALADLQVEGESDGPDEPRPGVVRFVLGAGARRAIARHSFPGNVRELALLIRTSCLMALSDALAAAESGRTVGGSATIPIPERLVDELIAGSWVSPATRRTPLADGEAERQPGHVTVQPRARLRDVARDLERDLFERLYDETGGDFGAMAARLLDGDPAGNARRVRLRFNQLGLRVRT